MKNLFLALALLVGGLSHAQNLDPTKLFELEYEIPPTSQTYATLSTFYVEMVNSYNLNVKGIIESEINHNRYKIVGERSAADVYLKVSSSAQTVSPKKYTSKTEARTDSKGNKYNVTTYTFEGTYKYTVMVEMINKNGEIVKSTIETSSNPITESASDLSSAESAFDRKKNETETSTFRSLALSGFRKIEAEYFIALESVTVTPIKVKSRKFDYTDMNDAADLVTTWLTSKDYNMETAEIKKAIAIYEAALQELNAEEKKVRVNAEIGAVCNYMLAVLNFAAKKYAMANDLILKSEGLDKRIHFTQEQLKDTLKKMQDKKVF